MPYILECVQHTLWEDTKTVLIVSVSILVNLIFILFYEEISKCDKIVIMMIIGKIYLFIEHIVFVKHRIKYRENVLPHKSRS